LVGQKGLNVGMVDHQLVAGGDAETIAGIAGNLRGISIVAIERCGRSANSQTVDQCYQNLHAGNLLIGGEAIAGITRQKLPFIDATNGCCCPMVAGDIAKSDRGSGFGFLERTG
jgi:hypothetical protein